MINSINVFKKLHISTYILCLLLVLLFIVVIFPVDYHVGIWSSENRIFCFIAKHGWPWVYYEGKPGSFYFGETNALSREPAWMSSYGWDFVHPYDSHFYFSYLLLDLITCLLIIAIIVWLYEKRCRSFRKIYQFSLKEMCVLSVAIAIIMSWWATNRCNRLYEDNVSEQFRNKNIRWEFSYNGPEIISKIIGTSWLRDFSAISVIEIYGNATADDIDNTVLAITKLKNVKTIIIRNNSFVNAAILDKISKKLFVEDILLENCIINDESMHALLTMPNLKNVSIQGNIDISKNCKIENTCAIKKISIYNSTITNEALYVMKELNNLDYLEISKTSVDKKGVEILNSMPGILERDTEGDFRQRR